MTYTVSKLAVVFLGFYSCFANSGSAGDSGVKLIISLDKRSYVSGQPIVLQISLMNHARTNYRRRERIPERDFVAQVTNVSGRKTPLSELGERLRNPVFGDTYSNDLVLAPGEVVKAQEDLTRLYTLTVPGTYHAYVTTQLPDYGKVTSNVVEFRVGNNPLP